MKRLNKVLSLVLVAVMVFTLVPFATASAEETDGQWVSAWSTSPIDASLSDLGNFINELAIPIGAVTHRMVIESTATGNQVRFVLSNEFSNLPIRYCSATVGKVKDSRIGDCYMNLKTVKNITVGGNRVFTIPAHSVVTTDPVDISVVAGEKLCFNIYYRTITAVRTIGLIGGNSYIGLLNTTRTNAVTTIPLKFEADSGAYEVITTLKEMDVKAAPGTETCVIFGDSTLANEVPRMLAQKLRDNGITNVSVTQEAIKGNRLIANGVGKAAKLLGASGVARFEKDVLQQPGVSSVIVKLGINDVVHPYCKSKEGIAPPSSLETMIAGYTELVEIAHAAGVKIYFCELTPWKGYTRNVFGAGDDVQWTPEIDQLRLDINAWFASDECPADGYITTKALNDPADPTQLIPGQTPDGIHHNPAGQANLVSQIPLSIFG